MIFKVATGIVNPHRGAIGGIVLSQNGSVGNMRSWRQPKSNYAAGFVRANQAGAYAAAWIQAFGAPYDATNINLLSLCNIIWGNDSFDQQPFSVLFANALAQATKMFAQALSAGITPQPFLWFQPPYYGGTPEDGNEFLFNMFLYQSFNVTHSIPYLPGGNQLRVQYTGFPSFGPSGNIPIGLIYACAPMPIGAIINYTEYTAGVRGLYFQTNWPAFKLIKISDAGAGPADVDLTADYFRAFPNAVLPDPANPQSTIWTQVNIADPGIGAGYYFPTPTPQYFDQYCGATPTVNLRYVSVDKSNANWATSSKGAAKRRAASIVARTFPLPLAGYERSPSGLIVPIP